MMGAPAAGGVVHAGAAAFDGSGIDGSAYLDIVHTAQATPGWLDRLISDYSSYGLALFAVFMLVAWWWARGRDRERAVQALSVPLITLVAFAVSSLLKSVVREARPCRSLHVITLEACPAPGDWSFPSNHTVLAAAAAVALWFVSARLGAVAALCALVMAASRVWVGVHYPHDIAAGLAVGALVGAACALPVRAWTPALSRRLGHGPLRPLIRS